jgi:uncharacterized membrane protein
MHAEPRAPRVASIDLIRGAAMVLMAIDHVRVFAGVPAGGPTPALFFTRWITHFCAPAFVFLAGTSAFFLGRRHAAGLSRHLLVRGAWLVLLELTIVRCAWTFNLDFAHYEMAGVLWAIGWSMIVLAGLVKLPLAIVAAFGLVVVAGHDLLDPHVGAIVRSLPDAKLAWLWKVLYVGFFAGPIQVGAHGPPLVVLYSLVPWVGVMPLGYALGRVLTLEAARRDRLCLAIGLGAIALFVLLRGFDLYGDPRPWRTAGPRPPNAPPPMPAWLAFLNTTKYPASLSFLLMTLGPVIASIPLLERARGVLSRWLTVFGRVPFFFYLLHIPLIHALALIVSRVKLGHVTPWLFENHPMGNGPPPPDYVWSLGTLYLVWAIAVALLWVPCRWFADLKARRSDAWLRFL